METYVFDGSLDGLLTAVFDWYELKPGAVKLETQESFQPQLMGSVHAVLTHDAKARRVWEGWAKKAGKEWQLRAYMAYLSEDVQTFRDLFDLFRYVFDNPEGAIRNFGHKAVLAVTQMERSVSRERHRMKAFIRFQETADGMFYAPIEPDFNVLPLISKFFQDRFADQRWLIYDLKRGYGLHYDLREVREITLDETPQTQAGSTYLDKSLLDGREELYGLLWRDYFKSTNIVARKNMKLHVRHVPKRYWKYLSEKR